MIGAPVGKTAGSLGGKPSIGGALSVKEPASSNPSSLGGTKAFGKASSAPASLGGAKSISKPVPKAPVFSGTPYSGRYANADRAPDYTTRPPLSTRTVIIDNRPIIVRHYGGWGDYSYDWGAPRWYYYAPWHPAFYFRPPMVYGGAMYPGGINFLNVFLGLIFAGIVLALILRLFRRR